jgi:hypothetical protein
LFRTGSHYEVIQAFAAEIDMKNTAGAKPVSAKPVSAKPVTAKPATAEAAHLAMLQFLAWIAERPRTYPEAKEGWYSCPHLSVWEDAIVDGLVRIENGGDRAVKLTPRGKAVLEDAQAHAD